MLIKDMGNIKMIQTKLLEMKLTKSKMKILKPEFISGKTEE